MSAIPMASLHHAHGRASAAGRLDGRSFGRRFAVAAGRTTGALLGTLALWRERAWQRRQLAMMDDYLLQDIGLTRVDVEQEYAKPFWRS